MRITSFLGALFYSPGGPLDAFAARVSVREAPAHSTVKATA